MLLPGPIFTETCQTLYTSAENAARAAVSEPGAGALSRSVPDPVPLLPGACEISGS